MRDELLILAPLRGVTIRAFRETFAGEIAAAGFTEAITPFIPAAAGYDPLKNAELRVSQGPHPAGSALAVTPQFIGKDPAALRTALRRVRAAGYATADLNAGCPYPMVRNKGRGSGLLKTPDLLRRMLEAGCEEMGAGRFSLKTRLGVERADELLALMEIVNEFPLRFLTVHARTARQMYEGACDREAFRRVAAAARVPVVANGDLSRDSGSDVPPATAGRMVGRSFVRELGARDDATDLALRYLAASEAELSGDAPVLGRMKELLSYWKDLPRWRRRWGVVKICRSLAELRAALAWRGDCFPPHAPRGQVLV